MERSGIIWPIVQVTRPRYYFGLCRAVSENPISYLLLHELTFLLRLRRRGAGYGRRKESRYMTLSNTSDPSANALRGSSLARTVEEMQVSLNLVSLKEQATDSVDQLTSALLVSRDNCTCCLCQMDANNPHSRSLTRTFLP